MNLFNNNITGSVSDKAVSNEDVLDLGMKYIVQDEMNSTLTI